MKTVAHLSNFRAVDSETPGALQKNDQAHMDKTGLMGKVLKGGSSASESRVLLDEDTKVGTVFAGGIADTVRNLPSGMVGDHLGNVALPKRNVLDKDLRQVTTQESAPREDSGFWDEIGEGS